MSELPLLSRGKRTFVERACDVLLSAICVIALAALCFRLCFSPVDVEGSSMRPTISDGEIVGLNKAARTPERGNIVCIEIGGADGKILIKRVVAVAGDRIGFCLSEGGESIELYLDTGSGFARLDEPYIASPMSPAAASSEFVRFEVYPGVEELKSSGGTLVEENTFVALGDNRNSSADSRFYGAFGCEQILGTAIDLKESIFVRAMFRIFYPFTDFGI